MVQNNENTGASITGKKQSNFKTSLHTYDDYAGDHVVVYKEFLKKESGISTSSFYLLLLLVQDTRSS